MQTYFLDVGPGKDIQTKAENTDNLRKNLIVNYRDALKMKGIDIIVMTRKGGSLNVLGTLYYHENQAWRYDSVPTGFYWYYKHKAKRVSPKTGALLDVSREWRYLRC